MKNGIKFGLTLVLGAVIGSVGTWFGVKDYYRRQYEEDTKSVKEAFHKEPEEEKHEDKEKPHDKSTSKEERISYSKLAKQYQSDAESSEPTVEPYMIDEDEMGEEEGYSTLELTYYADGVLADNDDDMVEDPDDIIGSKTLAYLRESEDDSVWVRDDARKRDIEILMDPANYTDIVKHKPGRVSLT